MDYSSALRFLDSFKGEGIKPRLEHTRFILDKIGFRQNFKVIHVAGSKGKGSVCAFANSILCEAGFRVGLYISPPLQDFTERISVNKKFISKRDVAELVEEIKPAVEELSRVPLGKPTIFEIITAMALRYFQLKKVDFAVLEVGMGGRLDATNVVDSLVSVVTEIELEHTKYLGTTIRQIAKEKAGIIKPNTTCVTASEDARVLKILEKICTQRKTKLIKIKANTTYSIQLLGGYQKRNAATAVVAVKKAARVSEKQIRAGLIKTRWPGRLEVVQRRPLVILDGSHTLKGARLLKESLKIFDYEKLYLVLGLSKDKPIKEITKELSTVADEVIATKAKNENAGNPKTILTEARKHSSAVLVGDVRKAVKYALKRAGTRDLILIAGSLYVVGEARSLWFKRVVL